MRKPLLLIIVACCLVLLAGSPAGAGSRGRDLPPRYAPNSLDGRLVESLNPVDGTRWAAWAYRNGVEYDLALAFRNETGFWSEPILIGVDDGLDQTQPALATDHWGNVYLAYTEQSPDRIMLCWLRAEAEEWTEPIRLTDPGVRGMYPALRVVGDRLVIAFRSGLTSVILDAPLLEPAVIGNGIEDTPDPVGAWDPSGPPDSWEDDNTQPFIPLDDPSDSEWGSTSTP